VKQLTDAEKQELETKIQKEKERQQALRERNPDLPETLEAVSTKTGLVRRFGLNYLWKYGMLAVILCLLAFNVFQFLTWRNFGSNKILNLNILVALMLLFTHIGFNFTKTGRKSRVMKTVACVWMVLVFVYIYISWVA
jgi:lipopolysaccharide export LptBFGC system permease protein LptF